MSVTIRQATREDVPEILRLVQALADYEHESDAVKATEADLAQRLFGAGAQVFAHLAELDGRAVGLAVWFLNFSTWTGRHGIYLEDLFVAPEARRMGVARSLFATLAKEAKARDCARIDWSVLDWNESAMDFYRSLGASRVEGWQPWRLQGDALDDIARD